MILFWSSVTASLIAAAGCGFLIAATILVARAPLSPARPRTLAAPSVTVLKPLHGDEPGLFDNLGSFCGQDYPGPVQIVFGVQDPGDRRGAVVERLQTTYPGAISIWLSIQGSWTESQGVEPHQHGAAHPPRRRRPGRQRHRVGPDYLRRVVARAASARRRRRHLPLSRRPRRRRLVAPRRAVDQRAFPAGRRGRPALGLARPASARPSRCGAQTLDAIGGFGASPIRWPTTTRMGEACARGHEVVDRAVRGRPRVLRDVGCANCCDTSCAGRARSAASTRSAMPVRSSRIRCRSR